jgi:hypothetical protein
MLEPDQRMIIGADQRVNRTPGMLVKLVPGPVRSACVAVVFCSAFQAYRRCSGLGNTLAQCIEVRGIT